jgi:hypothetical protein
MCAVRGGGRGREIKPLFSPRAHVSSSLRQWEKDEKSFLFNKVKIGIVRLILSLEGKIPKVRLRLKK